MNKKILSLGLIVVVFVAIVAAVYILVIVPRQQGTANTGGYVADTSGGYGDDLSDWNYSEEDDYYDDEFTDDEFGIGDDIGGGEIDPFGGNSIDADLESESWGSWEEIDSIWDGSEVELGEGSGDAFSGFGGIDWGTGGETTDIIDTSGEVNWGTPEVQTGSELSNAEVPTSNESSSAIVESSGMGWGTEDTTVTPNSSNNETAPVAEVQTPRTADPLNTVPLLAFLIIGMAVIGKLLLCRRENL